MLYEKQTKTNRILTIYSKLINDEIINKKEISITCNVSEKTIQRDIEDIRAYFHDNRDMEMGQDVIYAHGARGYYLDNKSKNLTKEDVLVLIKILLESRAFCKEELNDVTESLLRQVTEDQRKSIRHIIGNELVNYIPLEHNDLLLSKIWDFSELIRNRKSIQITYIRADNLKVNRVINPVAIIFSEYYFYLLAYFDNHKTPSIFRVDRIREYKPTNKSFYIAHSERFEDGEFRKRIQFMHTGELIRTRFEFSGGTLEAVIDRIPTARVIKQECDKTTIEAEVYGKGIIMWFLSQGSRVKVLSPDSLVTEIKEEIKKLRSIYR